MQDIDSIFASLPAAAKQWLESLSWEKRRYVLSLCHIMCAMSAEKQAEFLDDYTADGLVIRLIQDKETTQRVNVYLKRFQINLELNENVVRQYVRQFYIHSAQDIHQQPDLYLRTALRLASSTRELNRVFYYILGFELIKVIFQMSWSQHERFYRLQHNQEEFIRTLIRPIQHAHRINHIIIPKDEQQFFARRDYYVQQPSIDGKRLVEIAMATFSLETTTNLGLSIIRHPNSFEFDYEFIVTPEAEDNIFN